MCSGERAAELELVAQLYDGDLPGLFVNFGLKATHVSGDRWLVRAATPPGRQHVDLITSHAIAGPRRPEPWFDGLTRVIQELPVPLSPALIARREQIRAATDSDASLAAQLARAQVELVSASAAEHRQLVEQYFNLAKRWVDNNGPLFPQFSVEVVTATDALYRRARLPSLMLRMAQDPQLISELQTGSSQTPAIGLTFATSTHQTHSLVLNGSFLGPLLASMLPNMWGFACPRLMSTIVFGFGCTMPAARSNTDDLLQLLGVSSLKTIPVAVEIDPKAAGEAVDWWVLRLNQLFNYLTDPATYIDSQGRYAPHEQLHWMLTIEQVLRQTTSILTTVRGNGDGPLAVSYSLLGSFADRLLGDGVELKNLFNLAYAKRRFSEAQALMSDQAGSILFPAAKRALIALENCRKGFFITEQRGAGVVTVHMPDGTSPSYNMDDAVARLLLLHRNATHGYGAGISPRSRRQAEIDERLLAHHNGEIPSDVALLPYLYLLVVLSNPDVVRDTIIKRVELL